MQSLWAESSVIFINASSELYPHANILHELIGSRDPPIKSVMFYEVWKAAESLLTKTTDIDSTSKPFTS